MNRLALICCLTLITPLAVYAELPPGSYDTLRADMMDACKYMIDGKIKWKRRKVELALLDEVTD